MTYARSRLILGMSSVGTMVIVAATLLCIPLDSVLPQALDVSNSNSSVLMAAGGIGIAIAILFLLMLPFDFIGGYWLPKVYVRSRQNFLEWLRKYASATAVQFLCYVILSIAIIMASRFIGYSGSIAVAISASVLMLLIRQVRFESNERLSANEYQTLHDALLIMQHWGIPSCEIKIASRDDTGFTGGIIGWSTKSKIVIPKHWLKFEADILASILAKRSIAINTGSYTAGIVAAFVWNLLCFSLAIVLSGGTTTVAGLMTTIAWFTILSFVGLLALPTLSRKESLYLDQLLLNNGVSRKLLHKAATSMDDLQDSEPDRSRIVESIFHPIPSVSSRQHGSESSGRGGWQIARTSLFLSWACVGLLPRAVHCNVGRPDLWMLLPSD